MNSDRLPSLFVSHGPPDFILEDGPARMFLESLGQELTGRELPRPEAILCVSAHWDTGTPQTVALEQPETIHDYYGFPEELYALQYPAPGAPVMAHEAAGLLQASGFEATAVMDWGLDHGAWIPLMLMYPDADIPVAQLSIQPERGMQHHINVGRALAPLRDQGVLIIASGGAVHNLRYFSRTDTTPSLTSPPATSLPDWAQRFDDWLADIVERGDVEALGGYRQQQPDAVMAHPRDEHLLPLGVVMGAAVDDETGETTGRVLHRSWTGGTLSMAAYAFD